MGRYFPKTYVPGTAHVLGIPTLTARISRRKDRQIPCSFKRLGITILRRPGYGQDTLKSFPLYTNSGEGFRGSFDGKAYEEKTGCSYVSSKMERFTTFIKSDFELFQHPL